jgi:hypothetical protein
MSVVVDHTHDFQSGTRVMLLKGRNKDGADNKRVITKVTYSDRHWERAFAELLGEQRDGERIYCTAGARDIEKAARRFREIQLASEYDPDPMKFYRSMEGRWSSCLMQPTSQSEKFWLFDVDSDEEERIALEAIEIAGQEPYTYQTKNGLHHIVRPFNRQLICDEANRLLHDNALGLMAY